MITKYFIIKIHIIYGTIIVSCFGLILFLINIFDKPDKIKNKNYEKIYLHLKTWYQETPNKYYLELIKEFDNYKDVGIFLKENIEQLEDYYPIIEIIIGYKKLNDINIKK